MRMMTRGRFLFSLVRKRIPAARAVASESPNLSRVVHIAGLMLLNSAPFLPTNRMAVLHDCHFLFLFHPPRPTATKQTAGKQEKKFTKPGNGLIEIPCTWSDTHPKQPLCLQLCLRVGVCVLTPRFKEVINVCRSWLRVCGLSLTLVRANSTAHADIECKQRLYRVQSVTSPCFNRGISKCDWHAWIDSCPRNFPQPFSPCFQSLLLCWVTFSVGCTASIFFRELWSRWKAKWLKWMNAKFLLVCFLRTSPKGLNLLGLNF